MTKACRVVSEPQPRLKGEKEARVAEEGRLGEALLAWFSFRLMGMGWGVLKASLVFFYEAPGGLLLAIKLYPKEQLTV